MTSTTSDQSVNSLPPTGRSLSRRRRWLFRMMAIAFALLVLVAVEGLLRILGIGQDYSLVIPAKSPVASATHQLNGAVELNYYKSDLTGPEPRQFVLPKPKSTIRIVVLGASTVIGFPYPPELAFPRQIEVMLELQNPDLDIEVLNVGITAMNSVVIKDLASQVLACEPDIAIVYAGHNEFYGPGGGASTSLSNSSGLLQFQNVLRSTRLVQVATGLIRRGTAENSTDLMDELPSQLEIPVGDPLISQTEMTYRKNIESIITTFQNAEVPLVLSTVASNVRDQSPMRAVWPPNTSTSRKQEWEDYLLQAESKLIQSKYGDAFRLLGEAEKICDQHSRLVYRKAQVFEALGQPKEASQNYRLARDLDACRFRAPSQLGEVIRELADQHKTVLVDVEASLNEKSPLGPGYEWFLEHVHFDFAGHHLAAELFSTWPLNFSASVFKMSFSNEHGTLKLSHL